MGNLEKAGVLVVVILLGVIMAVAFLTDPDEGQGGGEDSDKRSAEVSDEGTPSGLRESRRVDEMPPADEQEDPSALLNRSEETGIIDVTDEGAGTVESDDSARALRTEDETGERLDPVDPTDAETESRLVVGGEKEGDAALPAGGTVTVEANDKLWLIARRLYGERRADRMAREIARANGISDPRRIRAGMVLRLPEAAAETVASGTDEAESPAAAGGARNAGRERPATLVAGGGNGGAVPFDPGAQPWERTVAATAGGDGGSLVVRPNETLSEIAQRELGSVKFVKDIMELNGIKDARKVRAGQTLKLPARTTARK